MPVTLSCGTSKAPPGYPGTKRRTIEDESDEEMGVKKDAPK